MKIKRFYCLNKLLNDEIWFFRPLRKKIRIKKSNHKKLKKQKYTFNYNLGFIEEFLPLEDEK